jgi:K(+)-stimulated pyrophosphate-energized sodium pump
MKTAGVVAIDVSQPKIMAGLLVGGMLPFVFSALSMNAVGRAAMAMIEEVRRQFRDIPALRAALDVMIKYDSDMSKASASDRKIFDAADGVAEYDKCVAISTQASIKEMVLPGVLAIVVPVAVGFIGGAEMLGGLLAGVTTCGVLMAIFQSNAGGAWDNAKKIIEEQGKKGTDAHKAAVVGDTVGDPFKDTSGPSLNILLKLMSVVALVIAPSIAMDQNEVYSYLEAKTDSNTIEFFIDQADQTIEETNREDFSENLKSDNNEQTLTRVKINSIPNNSINLNK